jgi:argininosuccinate lyase
LLTEKLGDAGKKIHTARSRNDQVLVDVNLYLKDVVDLKEQVKVLIC